MGRGFRTSITWEIANFTGLWGGGQIGIVTTWTWGNTSSVMEVVIGMTISTFVVGSSGTFFTSRVARFAFSFWFIDSVESGWTRFNTNVVVEESWFITRGTRLRSGVVTSGTSSVTLFTSVTGIVLLGKESS